MLFVGIMVFIALEICHYVVLMVHLSSSFFIIAPFLSPWTVSLVQADIPLESDLTALYHPNIVLYIRHSPLPSPLSTHAYPPPLTPKHPVHSLMRQFYSEKGRCVGRHRPRHRRSYPREKSPEPSTPPQPSNRAPNRRSSLRTL